MPDKFVSRISTATDEINFQLAYVISQVKNRSDLRIYLSDMLEKFVSHLSMAADKIDFQLAYVISQIRVTVHSLTKKLPFVNGNMYPDS